MVPLNHPMIGDESNDGASDHQHARISDRLNLDADLRRHAAQWRYHSFRGDAWTNMHNEDRKRYLVERGVPLAQVGDLLGHASITTTGRYDKQKLENLQLAAARLESGKRFDPTPRGSASPSICQVLVKDGPDHSLR
jgi:hypothetical protein